MLPALGWCARSVAFVILAIILGTVPSYSADVTLSLKGGGGFQISGELRSFDGKKYTIINQSFGRLDIDATRFDCIDGECPTAPVRPPVAVANVITPGEVAEITIAGSNTVGNQLMPNMIKAFAKKLNLRVTQVSQANPLDLVYNFTDASGRDVARINLFRRGSSTSFRALEAKEAQIGMSSRPIKQEEVVRLGEAGLGNMLAGTHQHVLGLDGLLVLTAPNNPAISMSLDNIAKVFAGQITDWAQLGLPGGPISVYAPGEDSGTWDTFNTLVLKPRQLTLVDTAKRSHNHAEQSDWVAADPLGIGVVGIAYQRSSKPLNIEASCGLITPPSAFAIKTLEYPLSRKLFLYSSGRPKETFAAGLLDFSMSDEAQPIVRKSDFVDQVAEYITFTDQGSRIAYALNAPKQDFDLTLMRTLLSEIRGSERMHLTFRFKTGSFTLDQESRVAARRLARLMVDGDLKDKPVNLIGFADSGGSFAANLTLSKARAEAVKRTLLQAEPSRLAATRLITNGYGELAPVACNDDSAGKAFNRRVEVWVERS